MGNGIRAFIFHGDQYFCTSQAGSTSAVDQLLADFVGLICFHISIIMEI